VTAAGRLKGAAVTVAGLGVSGVPAARALHALGAHVTVVNGTAGDRQRTEAAALEALGIAVRLGDDAVSGGVTGLPEDTELVVTSPGWKPSSPLLLAAAERNIDIWGDVELAWRLRGSRPDRAPAPWLAVTGTNGKTTTTRMLAAILTAAGLRTAAVGNIGVSLLDAVLGEQEYDVLAVELSSYQLHWAPSIRPHSAVVLNLAPDHLDWHGSMAAYAADKGRAYHGNQVACVYNAADPAIAAKLAVDRFGADLGLDLTQQTRENQLQTAFTQSPFTKANGLLRVDPKELAGPMYTAFTAAGVTPLPDVAKIVDTTVLDDVYQGKASV